MERDFLTIEVYLGEGKWIMKEFQEARKGDIIKTYNPDGSFHGGPFIVTDNPTPMEPEGNWGFEIDKYEGELK